MFARIDAEKDKWPIELQCDALGVSRSGYYAWRGRPEPARAKEDKKLVAEIKAAHKVGRGAYGSPRVYRELRANGRQVGRKRVERLMQQEGISARRKRRFRRTTDSNHPDPIAPNILDRTFDVELPNTAWVTDVTYVWTHEGWLYLAAILDLFSRRVVGWATSANNDRALALDALARATATRKPAVGLLHHSDRGSVYASGDYGDALTAIGAVKSMSRKGNCWDNAVAESFFATIKGEMLDHEQYESRAEANSAIGDYIEAFYNTRRRHSSIGYVSPIEFEMRFVSENMAA
jgi:transposase InsO family protein